MVHNSSSGQPGTMKEIDVELLVFVERYLTNLLKWDLVAFLAQNSNNSYSLEHLSQLIGRSPHVVRPELGDLVLLGLVDASEQAGENRYCLTCQPILRVQALKFTKQMAVPEQLA